MPVTVASGPCRHSERRSVGTRTAGSAVNRTSGRAVGGAARHGAQLSVRPTGAGRWRRPAGTTAQTRTVFCPCLCKAPGRHAPPPATGGGGSGRLQARRAIGNLSAAACSPPLGPRDNACFCHCRRLACHVPSIRAPGGTAMRQTCHVAGPLARRADSYSAGASFPADSCGRGASAAAHRALAVADSERVRAGPCRAVPRGEASQAGRGRPGSGRVWVVTGPL